MSVRVGKGPNYREGRFHVHLGMSECGMAYILPDSLLWSPCSKLVNHSGDCGFEYNTAF